MITTVAKSFAAAKRKYDRADDALGNALALGGTCLTPLHANATLRRFKAPISELSSGRHVHSRGGLHRGVIPDNSPINVE